MHYGPAHCSDDGGSKHIPGNISSKASSLAGFNLKYLILEMSLRYTYMFLFPLIL
jgi:hypothetical protein